MPRTHEMIESKYLKKEDVGAGTLATVRNLEKEQLQVPNEDPKTKWVMYFEELAKGLVLGPTTIGQCEVALGSDNTDDWIGKKLVLFSDPTVAFMGKVVGGIRVRAPRLTPRVPKASAVPPTTPQVKQPFSDMDDDVPF